MNIIILGAAGFIGTNLSKKISENTDDIITLVDVDMNFFSKEILKDRKNIMYKECPFSVEMDFEQLVQGQDIVYHLISSTVPTTSNQHISQELNQNVVFTSNLLDACVKTGVKKVIFISSGGTVYGKESNCPLNEELPTYPITSYGIQKVTIEKLLYLYQYMYGLDYRVVRLANPYGPYRRPNGILGAVTTFVYKALKNEEIVVYGDGTVVRDFIFIDDAINAIVNIAMCDTVHKTYNLGCGYGTSINQLLETIKNVLGKDLKIKYQQGRKVDVPVNYLDMSRYEETFGKINFCSLSEGIKRTAEFMECQKIFG